jgi:hypothetical protein
MSPYRTRQRKNTTEQDSGTLDLRSCTKFTKWLRKFTEPSGRLW